MAIRRVEIENFLVFQGKFEAEFCEGVNVIIGGNGTGKTTLLKVMSVACDCSKSNDPYLLIDYFHNLPKAGGLFYGAIRDISNPIDIFLANNPDITSSQAVYGDVDKNDFVFIPNDDMLSHSKGFLALDKERKLPFDKTYVDILAKAELPETREIKPNAMKTIDKIKEIIGGEVLYEGDVFYVAGEDGKRIPFSLEASGYRKFGLLWKLLRNGLLEDGSILFWDEPENSLNPEFISELVDILLKLSSNGVQIFITTHNELLASYFAVSRQKESDVMFTSLYKEDGIIKANTDSRFDLLEPNHITAEPVRLYKEKIKKGLGGDG